MPGPGAIRRDLQRLDTLADEPQRLTERTAECSQRAQLGDMLDERCRRPMIEGTQARSRTLEESNRGADDVLEADRPFRFLGNGRDHPVDPESDLAGQLFAISRSHPLVFRDIRIGGSRGIRLLEHAQRQVVGRASPSGFSARQGPRRMTRLEALVLFFDPQVTRLEEPAEVAGGEIRFDPVAEPDQCSSGARGCCRDAWAQRDWPVVPERLFPDQRQMRVGCACDLDLIQRSAGRKDTAEDFFDLRFAAASMEQVDRAGPQAATWPRGRHQQEREGIDLVDGGSSLQVRFLEPPRHLRTRDQEGPRDDALARHQLEETTLEWIPRRIRQLRPAVVRLDRAPVAVPHGLFVDSGHVAAVVLREKPLVRVQQRLQLLVLRGGFERVRPQTIGLDPSHPELAHRRPEGLRQCWLCRERPEVTALREVEQQAHHERGAETLLGRIDPTFNQERRAHPERDVERCNEPQVQPVRSFQRDPLTERAPDTMRRHEHPLVSGHVVAAQRRKLVDKWVHQ